jgi:L-rhamnonate dehydratase
MKIRDVKIIELSGHSAAPFGVSEARSGAPLDIYPVFNSRDPNPKVARDSGRVPVKAIYVRIDTDEDLFGLNGPIMPEQAYIIHSKLRPFLIGRDPLQGETLWDQMLRMDRHSRAGQMMMGISAVDIALWDIRGKFFDAPVYRLLGGPTREKIRAYGSMGGRSLDLDKSAAWAKQSFDQGFTAQKWFFRHGPADGAGGRRKNIELAKTLRETLGPDAELMFDCWMGWDAPFAIASARELVEYAPKWLEEPLMPGRIEGYKKIKTETQIALAAGEHLYTRWDVKPFLDAGALDYVQADPEWTGGITELTKICALADTYDVKVIPHGHHVVAAAHVIASQSPALCPLIEYLVNLMPRRQFFHTRPLTPIEGYMPLPEGPGIGIVLDESKIEEQRELKWD